MAFCPVAFCLSGLLSCGLLSGGLLSRGLLSIPHVVMRRLSDCLSVCVSVTFMHSVKTNKHIFEIFSPTGSQAILVFPHRTGWRYPDGNPLTGASNARGYEKMTIFDQYLALSQKQLYLDGHMQRDNL